VVAQDEAGQARGKSRRRIRGLYILPAAARCAATVLTKRSARQKKTGLIQGFGDGGPKKHRREPQTRYVFAVPGECVSG
jgi:hypothetical protein